MCLRLLGTTQLLLLAQLALRVGLLLALHTCHHEKIKFCVNWRQVLVQKFLMFRCSILMISANRSLSGFVGCAAIVHPSVPEALTIKLKVKVEFEELYCNGICINVVLVAFMSPILSFMSLYLIHQNQSAWLTALHADHPAAISTAALAVWTVMITVAFLHTNTDCIRVDWWTTRWERDKIRVEI